MDKNRSTYIRGMAKLYKAIMLLDGKCEICGEDSFYKLCFHHKDPEEKEFLISNMKDHRWSSIEKEVKKCQLLCHNCHQELHFNEKSKFNRVQDNKKLYLEYKNLNGCEICGYDKCNNALCFHHVDESKKSFGLSEILYEVDSLESVKDKITEELDKCQVLCQNCHHDLHGELFNEYKEEIIEKSKNIRENKHKIDREIVKKLYLEGMRKVDISRYLNISRGHASELVDGIKKSL